MRIRMILKLLVCVMVLAVGPLILGGNSLAISMTETMRLQQKRRFSQPKVRASAGFGSFIADTRLGFCYFKQVVQKSV